MDIKTFCKNQNEVADKINKLIDSYWNDSLSEEEMIDFIRKISRNNENKLYRESEFAPVIKLKCGKRRLELVTKILDLSE